MRPALRPLRLRCDSTGSWARAVEAPEHELGVWLFRGGEAALLGHDHQRP